MPYEPDHGEQLRKAFAVILIIIMVIAILSFFASAFIKEENSWLKAEQSKFIGTWDVSNSEYYYSYSSPSRTIWTFYENKTLEITNLYYDYYNQEYYNPTITFKADTSNNTLTVTNLEESIYSSSYVTFGSYKIENGKLYVKEDLYYDSYQQYTYQFSENNSKLYLSYSSSSSTKILTKTYESTPSSTVEWKNINITISGSGYIHYDGITLSRSFVSYYGSYAPSEWGMVSIGDVIMLGEYSFDTYVKFKWIYSDEFIDDWYFPVNSQPVSTDHLAYWDFNESTGDIVFDKSRNGNYGTIHGATRVSGISGSALDFNGGYGYVDLGETSFLSGATELTVSLWIKLSDYPVDWGEYRIFELGTYYGSSPNTILLYIKPNTNDSIFTINNDISVDGGVIPLDEWVHIVGTFKGGNAIKIYVDGVLKDTKIIAVPNSLNSGSLPTKIGGSEFGSNYYFNGIIDDVRIYNRVLTQNEIQKLHSDIISSKTFYVGGVGPGNYSKIQDAIDAADYGDKIYVYAGIYNERILVDKSINLIGEDKNTTIIDGRWAGVIMSISYIDHVNFSGFTIENTLENGGVSGIYLCHSECSIISDNIITGNLTFGIEVGDSCDNVISRNTISNITQNGIVIGSGSENNVINDNYINEIGSDGIWLEGSSYNNISENTITKCSTGFLIRHSSKNNIIYRNIIANTTREGIGLYSWPEYNLGSPENNIIFQNNFKNCGWYGTLNNGYYAIIINDAYNNYFYSNNFIHNFAHFQACDDSNNIFYNISTLTGNYWDDYNGTDVDGDGIGDYGYGLNCGGNYDLYPLMNPVKI